METRRGLLTKLGIYSAIAVSLFLGGKAHIASNNEKRHRLETDARVDSDENEFGVVTKRPGFPSNNPTLSYEGRGRASKYEGVGDAYSTRRSGDRLTMKSVFDWSWGDKPKD